MNLQEKSERGGNPRKSPPTHGRGGLSAPVFYRPENAENILALLRADDHAQGAPEWLKTLRYGALTVLEEQGLPTPKLERWKYSNLPSFLKAPPREWAPAVAEVRDPEDVAVRLGRLWPDVPDWLAALLTREPPGDRRHGDMALWHLNNAFLADGMVVDIPAGKIVEKPLEVTVTGMDGTFVTPRAVIRLGAGASLTLVEYHRGAGAYWANAVVQVVLGAGAVLRHYRIQDSAPEACHTWNTQVGIGAGGTYESFVLTSGAGFSRNQVDVALDGPAAHVTLNGVNLLRGGQLGDSTFLVEHRAPGCTSSQGMRSVLDDHAHGVFQGKVHVFREGQQTDGYQLSNALLLSEGAEMDTKPELEIYADDVKCSHGATTGQVDDEALFYLRSRGIPEGPARALLIEGFLAELVEGIACDNVRSAALGKIREWLKKIE